MSTRSFVGTVDKQGFFKARYVHCDGYPTHNGAVVAALVERDGVETVLKTLTEDHYGWSSLSTETPDLANVTPDRDAPYGTPENHAYNLGPNGIYGDGRFANVPGYGVAYTTVQGQSSPDEWIEGGLNYDDETASGLDSTWCEWGYLFDLSDVPTLHVIEVGGDGTPSVSGRIVLSVPVAALSDVDWGRVECGQDFERCSHYAWFHDPNVPEGSKSLSMRQWLGAQSMSPDEATTVTVEGVTYTLTGGGTRGSYLTQQSMRHLGKIVPAKIDPEGWYASATDPDGNRVEVLTSVGDKPIPGVEYAYPSIKGAEVGA